MSPEAGVEVTATVLTVGAVAAAPTVAVAALVSVSELLASSVEAHPHLEGRAQVGVDQGVGARILARNVGLRAVHPNPLVRVGGAGQPVALW